MRPTRRASADGLQAVTGFDVDRYAGHGHAVARTENSFERGLRQTSATYTRNANDTVKVVNRRPDCY